jgi:hypothetical protein
MSGITLYLRLVAATAVVLAPGWLLARALGVRGVAATLAWALTILFGALAVTFALQATLTMTLVILAAAAVAAAVALLARGAHASTPAPGQGWAWGAGIVLGILLWRVGRDVEGDGLFHLARVRKLLAFDELSLDRVSEFADGSLHPGYAFPLWHGFLALVAKVAGVDPEQVVVHLPSVLAVLAVVVAYEAGWAVFRLTWAAGAVTAAQAGLVCFAPGHGGSYTLLGLPATSSRQLLVPAAIALAFETLRRPSVSLYASTAAVGLALAVVHPTYAIFVWLPFAGFVLVRLLWAREGLRAGAAALAGLVVPAALFMLWLLPVVNDTASVSPDTREVQRALEHYASQLDVRSETSYSLAPEVFTRSGAVAVAALLLLPLAAFAARRRWAAFVAGGSLAVLVVMLVPLLFTSLADVVSISQARRAAGFVPFAFAFAGGLGVLSRMIGPFLPPLALVAGAVLQFAYPGDFNYVLDEGAPAWIVWVALAGGVAGLVVGLVRRGPPLEAPAGLAAALFLLPVVVVGLARWTPTETRSAGALSSGLVEALRSEVRPGAIVYSDPETSYRIAASAPVYIANAPPGHVADTPENRPYQRARDARRFLATGDLSIPEDYGAEYLVVDRRRLRRAFGLQEVYADRRFVLYRLPEQQE